METLYEVVHYVLLISVASLVATDLFFTNGLEKSSNNLDKKLNDLEQRCAKLNERRDRCERLSRI